MPGLKCKCGAYDASEAALRQMSPIERTRFRQNVENCETCRRDKDRTTMTPEAYARKYFRRGRQ